MPTILPITVPPPRPPAPYLREPGLGKAYRPPAELSVPLSRGTPGPTARPSPRGTRTFHGPRRPGRGRGAEEDPRIRGAVGAQAGDRPEEDLPEGPPAAPQIAPDRVRVVLLELRR